MWFWNSNSFLCSFYQKVHHFAKHPLSQPWLLARKQSKGLQRCELSVKLGSHISCSWECKKVRKNEPTHSQVGSHFGSWNPNGFPNFQKMISGVKIHWIEKFFYIIGNLLKHRCLKWLAWPILVLITQVMAKRKARSQIANLILDH